MKRLLAGLGRAAVLVGVLAGVCALGLLVIFAKKGQLQPAVIFLGLVLGGLLLLVLLLVGIAVLLATSDDDDSTPPTTRFVPGTTSPAAGGTTSPAAGGATTSVVGTGAATSITAADMTRFLREEQLKATPTLAVGTITCPPGPFRVGHVVICRMRLEDANVQYRVEVTSTTFISAKAVRPIIDTVKAEDLVETKEPGSTATCGAPRVRQVEIRSTFTCRTASSTWDFTVKDEQGQIEGIQR